MSREKALRSLASAIEIVLLAMVILSPWAYGAVHAAFEFLLDAGVGLLALLWSIRILLAGELTWKKCPVLLGLASLFVLGIWQIMPLPQGLLERLSPTTSYWYEQLLPRPPEELPFSEHEGAAPFRPGATISLCPDTTRLTLQRLLAVLLVFAVVRNNGASPSSFRRLAIAVTINGGLLALFGLAQFFSSPRNLLYWTYSSMGQQVFGPFVYRNHFACYINLCIGLGLGLLWSRPEFRTKNGPQQNSIPRISWSERLQSPLRLLHDPTALAICVALALMLSSLFFTLSRGGFLALLGGFAICFLIRLRGSLQWARLGAICTSLGLAAGLLGWLGLAKIEARYATLWEGKALHESRLPLWENALGIVGDFPIWGTGFGTYQQVDPLYRRNADLADLSVDHLHNDHLELLVEGGFAGLFLCWWVIGMVFFLGYRAVRHGEATSGLALGALFSFLTLALHGLGDFCIHVPAITLLATVLAAHMCAAGRGALGSAIAADANRSRYSLRGRGLAPIGGALALAALGAIVVNAGWTRHLIENLHQQALRADDRAVRSLEKKRDLLQAAVHLNAFDAELRIELGDVEADLFRVERDNLRVRMQAVWAASQVGIAALSASCGFPLLASKWAQPMRDGKDEERLRGRYLVPALTNYVEARDRAPLLPGAHLGLALFADAMPRADRASAYRRRVELLAPSDPTFWYYSGLQELRGGQPKDAWRSWRRSLELSDRYLNPILERSTKFLGPDELAQVVLPDRPILLLTAATRLYPRADDIDRRKPYLERALRGLDDAGQILTTKDLHTKALIYRSLRQIGEAESIYVTLLMREPLQAAWRFELAEVLYDQGKLHAAGEELATVLVQQPKHAAALELLTKVTKMRLRGK